MKKKPTDTPATDSKVDPTFVPKARVLIKKIKAKLEQLNVGTAKAPAKAAKPAKKKAAPKARAQAPAKARAR